jgi:hypothetical protein
MKEKTSANTGANDQPHRVRLPGFLVQQEIGLGDVIKRAAYALGIDPCSGCESRTAALNRWLVLNKRE